MLDIKKIDQRKRNVMMLTGISLTFLLWCVCSYSCFFSKRLCPSPTQVIDELIRLSQKGILLKFILISIMRVTVGWCLAAVVAVPAGLMIGISRRVSALFQPAIFMARYLPVAALLPLTLLYFGAGDFQICSIIFLGTFFQLALLVATAVQKVPRDFLRTGLTLGGSKRVVFHRVLIPAAMPEILQGMRLSIRTAWTYLVIAELVTASDGLGYMILDAERFMAADRIVAGLFILCFIGVFTDHIFKMVIELLIPWKDPDPYEFC